MKCNIRGLLLHAQRHLYLLDLVSSGKMDLEDLKDRIEVENCFEILEELIENIGIVQSDESAIDEFLKVYCIKKEVKS